jgi:ABC-2 type transport system permease protein
MTATAVARHARESPSPVIGVGTLIALAVRRDRVRLSVWIAVLTLLVIYTPNALKLAYPDEAQRISRVNC